MTRFDPVVLDVDYMFASQSTILQAIRTAGVDQVGERCSVFLANRLFGTVEQCRNAATTCLCGGCVHEHFRVWHACDRCTGGMKGEPQFCNDCSLSSEPHECEIRITAEPLPTVN